MIGIIIIGDEILSGRRSDKHLSEWIKKLNEQGLSLDFAHYLSDVPERIEKHLRESFASYQSTDDLIICCGGIGATPDDHTRQAAANAANQTFEIHEGAKALIVERIQAMQLEGKAPFDLNHPENVQRYEMARIAKNATLVPNPYNKIPGFAINQHFFLPGFPVMAWPMMDWILQNHAPKALKTASLSAYLLQMPEGQISNLLFGLERTYPAIKTFSLPSVGIAQSQHIWQQKPHIEFGVKVNIETENSLNDLQQAFTDLINGLITLSRTQTQVYGLWHPNQSIDDLRHAKQSDAAVFVASCLDDLNLNSTELSSKSLETSQTQTSILSAKHDII